MAMMDSSAWSGQDHPMQTDPDNNFPEFLNMGALPSLPDGMFDYGEFQHASGAHILAVPRNQLDTPMHGTGAPGLPRADPDLQHQMSVMTTAASYQSIPPTVIIPSRTPNEAVVDSIDAQIRFLQQQKLQYRRRQMDIHQAAFYASQQRSMLPPTPQSLELQTTNAPYYSQSSQPDQQRQPRASLSHQTPHHLPQQTIDYRYQRLRDQQEMSFTPLVSPAVTPLETHFPVDNPFTVPGSYFSPLTSPALHAQNDPSNAIFERRLGATNASTPEETGPETTIGPAPSTLPAPVVTKPGKTTRRSNPRSRSKVAVGMSPISKPQRRKAATTPKLNAQALAELVGSAAPSREPRAVFTPVVAIMTNASSTAGATDSENGSISPEALTDTAFQEMPPPPVPKPRSAKPSPFMAPQKHGTPGFHPTNRHDMTSPATPASLMVLSSPGERTGGSVDGSQEALETEQMEKFELPEPVTSSRPIMTPINTKPLKSPVPTADASTNKMSGLQTLPPPAIGKLPVTILASASPPIAPASATFNPRKVPQPMPRGGNKKRSGASSVQVSPALRPKISPNFKPLLPGGATAEETASHLLATKSNYQRILEGNTVPGVSYPSELSTNLTSKRTSHKIAEQGRRNRINSALQEMAALLPRPPLKEGKGVTSDDENSGDKKDKSASGPNSKASTVEMAIEFIKQLKQEVADANRRADEAEKKLVARSDE